MNFDVPPDIQQNVVFRHIWNEVHEAGKNQITITSGLPRTGKSELDVNCAWNLYRGTGKDFEHKFEIEKHCKWSKLDFQKTIKKYKEIGSTPMWDEAGIAELGAHARQFWSESNIAISTLFQIMGFHRQIVFISLPMKIMLDKHLRLLSHVNIETFKVKPKKNRCYAKVWWIEMSSQANNVYAKYPRFIGLDGLRYRIKTISMPRAPPEIVKKYKLYSEVFKEWLENKLIREEESRQQKFEVSANVKLKNLVKKIRADPTKYKDEKGRYDIYAIMMLENTSRDLAYAARGWAMKEEEGGVS